MATIEPCDSIGSPAQPQEVTVVSCIVHTDETDADFRRVKIPAHVPLFVRQKDGKPMMSNGVAHVELLGEAEHFIGISLDTFVANAGQESSNFISVGIAGAVTVATPNALFNVDITPYRSSNGTITPYLGKYVGLASVRAKKMRYEDTTCKVTTASRGAQYPIGKHLGHIDPVFDGIRVFLRSVPETGSLVNSPATGSDLGESDSAAAESAPAAAKPAKSAPKPARRAPAPAPARESMFVDPNEEDRMDAEEDRMGKKRPAAGGGAGPSKSRPKKKDA